MSLKNLLIYDRSIDAGKLKTKIKDKFGSTIGNVEIKGEYDQHSLKPLKEADLVITGMNFPTRQVMGLDTMVNLIETNKEALHTVKIGTQYAMRDSRINERIANLNAAAQSSGTYQSELRNEYAHVGHAGFIPLIQKANELEKPVLIFGGTLENQAYTVPLGVGTGVIDPNEFISVVVGDQAHKNTTFRVSTNGTLAIGAKRPVREKVSSERVIKNWELATEHALRFSKHSEK